MPIFEKDFLARVKARRAPAKSQQSVSQSESIQKGAEHPNSMDELARARGHTGPRIVGPPKHSSIKGSWRDDAKWLEENFEEFREPAFEERSDYSSRIAERSSAQPSSTNANSEPVGLCDRQPQPPANAPGSSQSVHEPLPAPATYRA
jgi:hypothetical protein